MMAGGFDGLIGALLFLAIGVAELALIQRFIYPVLRWRYEEAKVTGSQGFDPHRIMTALRLQCLVLLPLLGFLLGSGARAIFG